MENIIKELTILINKKEERLERINQLEQESPTMGFFDHLAHMEEDYKELEALQEALAILKKGDL